MSREDIDKCIIGLLAVTTGRRLPQVHPGEILRAECLIPFGISAYEPTKAIKMPRSRVIFDQML